MATIPASQARAQFTQALVDTYKEIVPVKGFLRSFFPTVEKSSKYLSIEASRGFELIALDTLRGTEGKRNVFGKSTEKIFLPPYFREFFDMTDLDLYDVLMGQENITGEQFGQLRAQASEKLQVLINKIERAYELQCAQVLETGVVTLNTGDNIDFNRDAASLVDNTSNPWTNGAVNPYDQMQVGCTFLRTKGKSQGSIINAIMGDEAYNAFLENTIVKERADIRNYSLDDIRGPAREATGAALHGQVSAGAFKINIWTYPEYYEQTAGTPIPYVNPKNVILLPENPRFHLAFAAVPQLINGASQNVKGAYKVSEFTDEREASHIVDVQSAGLAIPVAVDQIWTAEVVA